jgi:hypothetical protein
MPQPKKEKLFTTETLRAQSDFLNLNFGVLRASAVSFRQFARPAQISKHGGTERAESFVLKLPPPRPQRLGGGHPIPLKFWTRLNTGPSFY